MSNCKTKEAHANRQGRPSTVPERKPPKIKTILKSTLTFGDVRRGREELEAAAANHAVVYPSCPKSAMIGTSYHSDQALDQEVRRRGRIERL
jgi:hypothetical protein